MQTRKLHVWPTGHGIFVVGEHTHWPVRQFGARGEPHWALVVHVQAPVSALQVPPKTELLQSPMFLHGEQTPPLHAGRAELHCSLVRHSTHWWAATLHSGRAAPQSRLLLQPHAPATQSRPASEAEQSWQLAPHEVTWVSSRQAPARQQ
jgi:hypothetical protein